MTGRLEGKVVAITGSGSGLGRDAALLFAEHGARIVASDYVTGRADAVVAEITASGGKAFAVDADVREDSAMRGLVAAAVDHFGQLDVMWANAGIPEPGFGTASFLDSKLEDWHDQLATHMTGIYLPWKYAARHMADRGAGGALLATTSAAAFNAYPGFPMYAASKAGANGLVRAAALELGKYGIRANALCPTHGMSINFALPPDSDILGLSYEQLQPWDAENRAMPLKLNRPPTLRDNAYLALFLASDEAAYVSGQTIRSCDGANSARTSIIFPTDLGGEDIAADLIPEELRAQMPR
jgi:NAD(P)-dependent dehydrogenase (short-subunit alcohol dehydrogenase family)